MTMPMPGSLDADPQAHALGAALGTQYTLVRLLGRGGMGAVYLAHEPFLDRHVAVKVLPADLATGESRERFLREARTAARLSHPNIVPLHTFGQAGELLYFLMGYVDGESLESRLRREGRIAPEEARVIIGEIADALDYAHQQGVVHRDVKPDNILLDRRTGRAMLTDFGIAKQPAGAETLTGTGIIVGTPHYMSPEQATGDTRLDGRSDIYSLGVIAYRMLAGRLPFEGARLQEVLTQHVTRTPEPLNTAAPDVPLELAVAVTRTLAKTPAERWPTAGALRDSVRGVAEDVLPDELRDIRGMGVRTTLIALGLTELGALLTIYNYNGKWIGAAIVAAASLLVPLVGMAGMIAPGRKYGRKAALRSWFHRPSWWGGWWPRFGRPDVDVWDRLPAIVRTVRTIDVVAWMSLPVFVDFVFAFFKWWDPANGAAHDLSRLAIPWFVGSAALMVPQLRYRKWYKAAGLSTRDGVEMGRHSLTDRAFWSRPPYATLLSSGSATSLPRERSASELLHDVEIAASELTSASGDGIRADMIGAARALNAAIRAGDDELSQIARDADPAQHARVVASLDALGPVDDRESSQKRELRELLGRQLTLYRDLETRRAVVSARRDTLLEQLRTLALYAANLRAQGAANAGGPDVTDRVRAIVEAIDYHLAGAREADEALRLR